MPAKPPGKYSARRLACPDLADEGRQTNLSLGHSATNSPKPRNVLPAHWGQETPRHPATRPRSQGACRRSPRYLRACGSAQPWAGPSPSARTTGGQEPERARETGRGRGRGPGRGAAGSAARPSPRTWYRAGRGQGVGRAGVPAGEGFFFCSTWLQRQETCPRPAPPNSAPRWRHLGDAAALGGPGASQPSQPAGWQARPRAGGREGGKAGGPGPQGHPPTGPTPRRELAIWSRGAGMGRRGKGVFKEE